MQRITRAVELKQYNQDYQLAVGPANLPLLQPNQVLVRLEWASVTAADVMFMQGRCPVVRSLPAVPGFEASGTVVETGSRMKNWRFQGKRVGVFALDSALPGTWAEYAVVQSRHCFPLNDSISFEHAACMFLTPLTICMFEEVFGKSKGVIQTGGSSAVTRTLLRVCNYKAIACICVIDSPEEVESLSVLGAQYILVSSDPDFETKAHALCQELNVRVGFDCVGGCIAGQVLNALQPGGVLYSYEETQPAAPITSIQPKSLIFEHKKLIGLNLFTWFEHKHPLQKLSLCSHIQRYYFMYRQEVMSVFPMHEIQTAVEKSREVGRQGKILLQLRVLPVVKQPSNPVIQEEEKKSETQETPSNVSPKKVLSLEQILGKDDDEEVEITTHEGAKTP